MQRMSGNILFIYMEKRRHAHSAEQNDRSSRLWFVGSRKRNEYNTVAAAILRLAPVSWITKKVSEKKHKKGDFISGNPKQQSHAHSKQNHRRSRRWCLKGRKSSKRISCCSSGSNFAQNGTSTNQLAFCVNERAESSIMLLRQPRSHQHSMEG